MIAAGLLVDRLGAGVQTTITRTRWGVEARTSATIIDPRDVRHEQPSAIAVDRGHSGPPLGVVEHLEITAGGELACVASIVDDAASDDDTFSISVKRYGREGWDIVGVSLTRDPGGICLGTIRLLDGATPLKVDDRTLARLRAHGETSTASLVERARIAMRHRRRGEQLRIVDTRPPEVVHLEGGGVLVDGELVAGTGATSYGLAPWSRPHRRAASVGLDHDQAAPGPIEIRPCGPILSVR